MKITIEHYPKKYNNIIFTAGRNCYGCRDAGKTSTKEHMQKFTKMLINKGHLSVLEHICISIYAKDVSRSFLAQLTRHRLVSYSVKSQHYVKHTDFAYKDLENWGDDPKILKSMYKELMETINMYYKEFVDHGIPHYIAREVLPNACLTDMYLTTNAREWRHIIKMRIGKENTPEIKTFAETLLRLLYLRMPEIFEDLRDKYLEAGA